MDDSDPAFLVATTLVGLQSHYQPQSVEETLDLVRAGVVPEPPEYVLELSGTSMRRALRESALDEDLWPSRMLVSRLTDRRDVRRE
jgi:hypothetical protein